MYVSMIFYAWVRTFCSQCWVKLFLIIYYSYMFLRKFLWLCYLASELVMYLWGDMFFVGCWFERVFADDGESDICVTTDDEDDLVKVSSYSDSWFDQLSDAHHSNDHSLSHMVCPRSFKHFTFTQASRFARVNSSCNVLIVTGLSSEWKRNRELACRRGCWFVGNWSWEVCISLTSTCVAPSSLQWKN